MHRHKIGRFLITFGVTLVVYAMFFMRISVDGNIVNLSLLSNRQNMVIIGALAVIAGLILRYPEFDTKRCKSLISLASGPRFWHYRAASIWSLVGNSSFSASKIWRCTGSISDRPLAEALPLSATWWNWMRLAISSARSGE